MTETIDERDNETQAETVTMTEPGGQTDTEVQPDDTEVQPDASESDETQAGDKTSRNAEAAKYRVQAKEAREEVERLTERVTGLQRQLVEAYMADKMANPSDFWRYADLEAVLAEDGTIDAAKLQEVAEKLQLAHGYLFRPVIPKMRPKLPRGVPVRSNGSARQPSSLDKAFGSGSGVKFSDVLHKQGTLSDAVRPSKGRADVSLNKRDE